MSTWEEVKEREEAGQVRREGEVMQFYFTLFLNLKSEKQSQAKKQNKRTKSFNLGNTEKM